ncbi:Alpha carbonic anhydrase 7 isoform 1 [Tripterygium wilfordii]|uniref:Carbonic anhydrase n=1 Tax=Tripterygium wilfordii TaxID=458696 RepID=A0A7J7DNB7_TRIWF|nr:alpha carbonic anhydrase 7-like [Tripterygium wilfordii]KAF5747860.1 Alpha carbonic anhydrase 7 isoform 1 [Tripterygium wilfordii]
MKNQNFLIFVVCIVLQLTSSATAQEVEDEREFDYLNNSEKGPRHWGEIKKEWEACRNGTLQSPIDLTDRRVKLIRKLVQMKKIYKPCNATVKNRGHDISLQWEEFKAGSIQINGTNYFLQQAHWHSPSEHTINGRRYDLELHMVHASPDQKVAVIGLLYKLGHPDHFLSKLIGDVMSMSNQKAERGMGVIDPSEIKMGGKKYYRYLGSLTVPPCTEGVIWTINKKIRTVSRGQVELLREAVHDYAEVNARPVQPLNRRDIHLYGPSA